MNKPCPFCGCEKGDVKTQQRRGQRFFYRCLDCGAEGPVSHDGRFEARLLWNRRSEAKETLHSRRVEMRGMVEIAQGGRVIYAFGARPEKA